MFSSYSCLILKPSCFICLVNFPLCLSVPFCFLQFCHHPSFCLAVTCFLVFTPFCLKCFLAFSYFLDFHVAEVDFLFFLMLFRLILVLILALLWPESFLFWLRWPGFACICNMIQPLLVSAGNSNRLYCMLASDKPITLHLHYNCWRINLFQPPLAIMLEVFLCTRTRKPHSDAACSAVFVCGCECLSPPL